MEGGAGGPHLRVGFGVAADAASSDHEGVGARSGGCGSFGGSVEGIADGSGSNSVAAVFAGSSDYGDSNNSSNDDAANAAGHSAAERGAHSSSSSSFGKPLPHPLPQLAAAEAAADGGGGSPYSSDSNCSSFSPRLPPRVTRNSKVARAVEN